MKTVQRTLKQDGGIGCPFVVIDGKTYQPVSSPSFIPSGTRVTCVVTGKRSIIGGASCTVKAPGKAKETWST